jgi:hypothetical protein
VVWHNEWPANKDIYTQRVSGDGAPQGSSGGFPVAGATSNLYVESDVAYGMGYGYLVAWTHDATGSSDYDVYARYVLPGRDVASGGEFVIDATAHDQEKPSVA